MSRDSRNHHLGHWAAIGLGTVALSAVISIVVLLITGSNGQCDGCGVETSVPTQPVAPATVDTKPNPRLFSPKSIWNAPIPAGAPVDPASSDLVKGFVAEIDAEQDAAIGPWIQTTESSTPLYTVPRHQPDVTVHVDDMPEESYVDLQRAFNSVPIPEGALPAGGSDAHMTIFQPSTDKLWEFWQAHMEADGWHASWGGAINHVSKDPGYYTPDAYPGATTQWGSTASSLPVIGGTILASELEAGTINHALALDIPDARAGVFAWPAQRTDGTGGSELLPEGARLRLDPDLDLDSLDLPPAARTIAEAAQKYGVIVRDRTYHATAFYAEDPTPTGSDPYPKMFNWQLPSEVLLAFPWDRLQVMKMHLCTAAPCSPPPGPRP
jgi:hypothetical protein